ncbi:MAG: hypothetical protein U0169_24755 [Polyangiaceae bacterium]
MRTVAFGGVRVGVDTARPESPRVAACLAFALRRIPAAPPGDVDVTLEASEEGDELVLRTPEGVFRERDPSAFVERIDHRLVYHLVDPCRAGLAVHAALVRTREGHGVVIPGESGAGKSTLATSLLLAGHDVVTDELTLLGTEGPVHGFSRPLHLKPAGAGRFAGALAAFETLSGSAGTFVHPPGDPPSPSISAIVFPRRADGEETVRRVPASEAARRLLGTLINARNLDGHGVPLASAWARRVPAFEIAWSTAAFADASVSRCGAGVLP